MRSAIGQFEGYIKLNRRSRRGAHLFRRYVTMRGRAWPIPWLPMPLKLEDKQKVLKIASVS